MIATDRRQPKSDQAVGGTSGFQRPRQTVTEIDDIARLDALRRDIGKNGFKGKAVAVHIGDCCKTHQLPLYVE
ncbi:hypothetical protein D3C86_2091230 [compost metagenome]